MKSIKKDSRGWTLMEMVVVLAIIAILAAILTPIINSYVERARINAASQDVKNIAAAVTQFNTDTRVWPIYTGTFTTLNYGTPYHHLYTDGLDAVLTGTGWNTGTSTNLNFTLNANAMGLPTSGKTAWKGAYLELSPDPWGSRYYLTALNLSPTNTTDAAYVLSPGPDQTINTAFTISRAGAVTPSGDDILQRIR